MKKRPFKVGDVIKCLHHVQRTDLHKLSDGTWFATAFPSVYDKQHFKPGTLLTIIEMVYVPDPHPKFRKSNNLYWSAWFARTLSHGESVWVHLSLENMVKVN